MFPDVAEGVLCVKSLEHFVRVSSTHPSDLIVTQTFSRPSFVGLSELSRALLSSRGPF